MKRLFEKVLNFIKRKNCKHNSINEYHHYGFCPDCGEKVVIQWQNVRCRECNSLLMQKVSQNGKKIKPLKKHCPHCGSADWYIKTSYDIDFTERMYSIYQKQVLISENGRNNQETIEIWIEEPEFNPYDLFNRYRKRNIE